MKRRQTFGAWANFAAKQLSSWAAARDRRLPTWDRILVTEEENGERTGRWVSPDEFEARFQQVLQRTTRSWVNLHVDPIENGVLRLVVEYISRHDKGAVSVQADKISVNLSGPPVVWFETLPAEGPVN
jgi:hypothetical protein